VLQDALHVQPRHFGFVAAKDDERCQLVADRGKIGEPGFGGKQLRLGLGKRFASARKSSGGLSVAEVGEDLEKRPCSLAVEWIGGDGGLQMLDGVGKSALTGESAAECRAA
jgi:hypothetical protein